MIKISKKVAEILADPDNCGIGIITEFGAVIGDEAEFVIYYPEDISRGIFLVHISEVEQSGFLVRVKE